MYYKRSDLLKIGFKKVGNDVLISDKCSIYGAENITIGNNVRIDDFCMLSAGKEIIIGNNVHIGCYSVLMGRELIQLFDYSGVSMKCIILSSNADYSGEYMTNPNLPEEYLNTISKPIILYSHSLVGAGSILLPGVVMGMGAVLGAQSLLKGSIYNFQIWGGSPAKYIKKRSRNLLRI